MDRMKARQTTTTAMGEAATATATTSVAETSAFAVSEAEIKKNPVYALITDTSRPKAERLAELAKLKAYDPALTPEKNAEKRAAFGQMLLQAENQVLAITSKAVEFTNDEAFSLYDQSIQKLQDNLRTFKGNLEPLVDAFGVMQKARAANIPPHKLLEEVQQMREARTSMNDEKAVQEAAIVKAKAELKAIQDEAAAHTARLDTLNTDVTTASTAKAAAEGIVKAEGEKFFLSRDKKAMAAAQTTVSDKTAAIERLSASIMTLSQTATATASKLTAKEQDVATMEAALAQTTASLANLDSKLADDADTAALSKLLEITGSEFKAKRDELTGSVKNLIADSVKDFEKSMARFESGAKEIGAMRVTTTNVNGMITMIDDASKMATEMDASFMAEQEAKIASIKETKGDRAEDDPAYELAKVQLTAANEHAKDGASIGNRASEFAEKLTRAQGTYTAMGDAFTQKYEDARRLRTNAAVDVSSKLLMTTKSLEMAIAGERTMAVDDILAELSETSSRATRDVFNMVSTGKDAENQRLAEALRQAIDTAEAIDAATQDLKKKAKENLGTRAALDEIRGSMDSLNEGLANVTTDTARGLSPAELQAIKEQAADRAVGAPAPATPKP